MHTAGFGIMSTLLFGVVYAGLVLIPDMRDLWKAVGRYVLDATVVAGTTAGVGFVVMTTSAREVRVVLEAPTMNRREQCSRYALNNVCIAALSHSVKSCLMHSQYAPGSCARFRWLSFKPQSVRHATALDRSSGTCWPTLCWE